jgi:hypothetical protein
VASAALSELPGMNLMSWIPPPSGMVMVEMMVRVARFQRRSVFAFWMPRVGLEDGQGDDEISGQDDVLVKVDAQTVRGELFAKNVEKNVHVLWPFVEDVALSISFRQAVREMCRLHCPYM